MAASEVAQCLVATLSPDTGMRIAAELQLSELLTRPETGFSLSQLILTQDADLSLRQITSITLRKYVRERWSPYFNTFKGSAPSFEVKTRIRGAIFTSLSDPNRQIRTLCAHTLSVIANSDWPDEYPDLLMSLIALLSSNSSDSVHGAIQVLTEFIKSDLTEDQILPVLRALLPALLSILGSPQSHSAPTRARTVTVFRQCVKALYMVKDQHPQAVKEATAQVLPIWLEAFKVLLQMDPAQDLGIDNWDGLTVRIQIFKTLECLHTSFPRVLAMYIPDLLSASVNHMRALYPTFSAYYLSASETPPSTSEGEPVEFSQLLCPILDFLSGIIQNGKAREWLDADNISAMVSSVSAFVQMTDEDIDTWAANPNTFVAQEEDETQSYSIRVAGFDLLGSLIEQAPIQCVGTFQRNIKHIIGTSEHARNSGNTDWWRPLEAALAVIGSQSESIIDCIGDEQDSGRPTPIDIDSLLVNVVPPILNASDCPFLQGRGFVFASQYSKLLPLQLAGHYLNAAVQVLETGDAGVTIKVSAIKAIHNFCNGGDDAPIIPLAARIARGLGPFLLVTSEDTLSLILETLAVMLEIDHGNWLTADLAASLTNASLEVWNKNNKDPMFVSVLTDIFMNLASSKAPGIYEIVVKQALPPLSLAIGSAKEQSWIAASGIDLVGSLIQGAPDTGVGEGFFQLFAPHLFSCLSVAEDRDILQNGISCLTLMIRKDVKQLLSWNDGNGRRGVDWVLSLIARMLDGQSESGGLQIGDLIIHLLRQAGEAVLTVLPELLRAMVSRMTTAKTATFLQSLIIPFAFLIKDEPDTILSLLETTNIDGRSGLDILIQTWCENAETFQGFWPSRVSTLAFTMLFASGRSSLQNLMVKGDLVIKPEAKNAIMTRSKTKKTPHEFTSIPFPVKALKIIVHDVQSGGDAAILSASQPGNFEVESDDGDEDWTEEERAHQGFKADEFAVLSDMLGPKGIAFDNDEILKDSGEDSDDEDLRNDPVSQLDMQAHLQNFLRECAVQNTNNFQHVVDQLSVEEILVVRSIVNSAH